MAGNPQGGGAPNANMGGQAGQSAPQFDINHFANYLQNYRQAAAGAPSQTSGANVAAPGGGSIGMMPGETGQGGPMQSFTPGGGMASPTVGYPGMQQQPQQFQSFNPGGGSIGMMPGKTGQNAPNIAYTQVGYGYPGMQQQPGGGSIGMMPGKTGQNAPNIAYTQVGYGYPGMQQQPGGGWTGSTGQLPGQGQFQSATVGYPGMNDLAKSAVQPLQPGQGQLQSAVMPQGQGQFQSATVGYPGMQQAAFNNLGNMASAAVMPQAPQMSEPFMQAPQEAPRDYYSRVLQERQNAMQGMGGRNEMGRPEVQGNPNSMPVQRSQGRVR